MEFKRAYINLTNLVRNSKMINFKEKTKEIKRPVFKNKILLFKPLIQPTTFGTFASEFISFKLSLKKYKESLKDSPWYQFIPLNQKEKIDNNIFDFLTFASITYAVIAYRVGGFRLVPSEKISLIDNENYKDKDFEKDFEKFQILIDSQIKKHIKTNKIIINPTFGSLSSGVRADGDLIVDDSLVEIKCSKSPNFKIDYLRQLIGYKCLNNLLKEKYYLSKTFIYWNPFYDIFEKITIDNFEEIEKTFNKNRIETISEIKNSKLD